ncbi:MAG: ester cyclase [bacterium]
MSLSDNKAVVQKYFELLYNHADPEGARHLVTSHFAKHLNSLTETLQGFEAVRAAEAEALGEYPDKRVKIEMMLAEGDKVCALWTTTGTKASPPGAELKIHGTGIFRIEGNRIAEEWEFWKPASPIKGH